MFRSDSRVDIFATVWFITKKKNQIVYFYRYLFKNYSINSCFYESEQVFMNA